MKADFEGQLEKSLNEVQLGSQNQVTELRTITQNSFMEVDKKMTETKNDVGKQMHELCFMVEQLATMTRGFENQLGAKKPEIESANMNIANL